jgi:hypothetical protein
MAKLNGGSWRSLQKEPVGTVTEGAFVNFRANVPSQNPAYPPQGVLKMEVDGEEITIGCPKQLAGVFEEHDGKIAPGTIISITYNGQKQGKKGGKAYHFFDVETVDEPGSNG